jgi:hypothetical protein
VALATAGCQVHTQVDIQTKSNGTGQVDVSVTFDRAAAAAVGDLSSQLRTSDLRAAGWTVTGPFAAAAGSTEVEASHRFSDLAQASAIVAEIAGSGSPAQRPFRLALRRTTDWWGSHTFLSGVVDLHCDLACFGDPGLTKQLGTSTGIKVPAPSKSRQEFTFGVQVSLPGTLQSAGSATRAGDALRWRVPLGSRTVLSATTSTLDETHIVGTAVAGGVGLVVLVIAAVFGRRRFRRFRARRRDRRAMRRGRHVKGSVAANGSPPQSVTPDP